MKTLKKNIYYFFLLSSNCFAQTWSTVGGGVNQSGGAWIEDMDIFQNKLYICGGFQLAGSINASGIACWDGTKWDSLGAGTYGHPVRLTNSDTILYAGGSFLYAGNNVPNTYLLAKWNGNQWLSINSNYPNSSQIYALKYKNDFYVGGNFNQVGSLNVNRIASWNGTSWSNMSGGVTGGFIPQVQCMAVYNGELYVGGDFTFAGGKPANYIARWNGTSWDSVGSGFDYTAAVMFVDTTDNLLYVSGAFTTAGSVSISAGVAKWDGTNWSNVGVPYNYGSGVNSFALYRGKLFLGYYSGTASVTDTILASWDGTTWKRIEGPNDGITSLMVYNDKLYVGGYFSTVKDSIQGTLIVNYIASYSEPPSGVNEIEKCKFNVYPNPAKEEININVEGEENKEYIAKIYNNIGAKIVEKKFSKQTKISTVNFLKGIYQVQVCNKDGKICHTEKIVLE